MQLKWINATLAIALLSVSVSALAPPASAEGITEDILDFLWCGQYIAEDQLRIIYTFLGTIWRPVYDPAMSLKCQTWEATCASGGPLGTLGQPHRSQACGGYGIVNSNKCYAFVQTPSGLYYLGYESLGADYYYKTYGPTYPGYKMQDITCNQYRGNWHPILWKERNGLFGPQSSKVMTHSGVLPADECVLGCVF